MKEKVKKFVYEDANTTKVIKGIILGEDDFTYTIRARNSSEVIILGKRNLIKICDLQ